jgi:hypothetical protein
MRFLFDRCAAITFSSPALPLLIDQALIQLESDMVLSWLARYVRFSILLALSLSCPWHSARTSGCRMCDHSKSFGDPIHEHLAK